MVLTNRDLKCSGASPTKAADWHPFTCEIPKGGRLKYRLDADRRKLGKKKAHNLKSCLAGDRPVGGGLPVGCPGVKDLYAIFGTQGAYPEGPKIEKFNLEMQD